MISYQDQKGVGLSSLALLLILPALLIVASGLKIAEMGSETNAIQILADKVSYTGKDIFNSIKLMEKNRFPIDNTILQTLAEKYRSATGLLVEISLNQVHPLWIHVQNTGADHYAGSKYCDVEKISDTKWGYSFEDFDESAGDAVDFDYGEPNLLLEKTNEKIKIAVLSYDSSYFSDVYYSKILLWSGVGGIGKTHVGETVEIEENLFGFFSVVSIKVQDLGGIARYSENILLK
ncbi:MAG: hypothetical protein ACP5PX_05225 [Candidatus Hadarchaeum sp.]|uniref:hypothetical protein n=1 Tax=Candidatus Hadarchaeum sp. TaxID=2883567 RepID=UPI003D13CC42